MYEVIKQRGWEINVQRGLTSAQLVVNPLGVHKDVFGKIHHQGPNHAIEALSNAMKVWNSKETDLSYCSFGHGLFNIPLDKVEEVKRVLVVELSKDCNNVSCILRC